MAAEIKSIRDITRRVKQKALDKAEFILDNEFTLDENGRRLVSKELYEQTYLTVLKNAVPRTQEITGEDGQPISISFDPVFSGK